MKVLLIGEFSSFHKYLKDGLNACQAETTLAATSDGWKQIPGRDVLLYEEGQGNILKRNWRAFVSALKSVSSLRGYDVISLICPAPFHTLNPEFVKWLKRNNPNAIISISCVGEDLALHNAVKDGKFEYYIEDFVKENEYAPARRSSYVKRRADQKVIPMADVLIPGLYEYSVGYQDNPKLHAVIPEPVNIQEFEYQPNIVKDKIVIFHGINREKSKGTRFIKEALERIQEKYPDQVEVIIQGRMPFAEYVQTLKRTNIVVDQCCGYGYGINALISMAQGKVVFAGNRPETMKAFGIEKSAVVHIEPNPQMIFEKLESFILHPEEIEEHGKYSRRFVEELHDARKVAAQYIQAWKEAAQKKGLTDHPVLDFKVAPFHTDDRGTETGA